MPGEARGYSWPPFEAGNTAAQTHGIYSIRAVLPRAAQIARALRAEPELDYLNAPRFKEALQAYAQAQARADLHGEWLGTLTHEEAASDAKGTPPLEVHRQLIGRAVNLSDRIGLTPMSAVAIADEIAAARRTLARRIDRKQLHADMIAAVADQVSRARGEQ